MKSKLLLSVFLLFPFTATYSMRRRTLMNIEVDHNLRLHKSYNDNRQQAKTIDKSFVARLNYYYKNILVQIDN